MSGRGVAALPAEEGGQKREAQQRLWARQNRDGCAIMDYEGSLGGALTAAQAAEWVGEIRRPIKLYELDKIWKLATGRGVTVAVIDTGIDGGHPAFAREGASVVKRHLVVKDGDLRSLPPEECSDDSGHGTHCAGLVAAQPHFGEGVPFCGMAPDASLFVYKALGKDGQGRFSDVALAVDDAVAHGVDIVSLSIQGRYSSDLLYAAIQRALAHRRFVICAAGNGGQLRTANIGYPGRWGGVITVAAHNRNGGPTDFTATGGEIDIAAPGQDVWSTLPGGCYGKRSGTSMAAPWVAGIAALLLEEHRRQARQPDAAAFNKTPLRNNEDLRDHLLRMAAHAGTHDDAGGYGPIFPVAYYEEREEWDPIAASTGRPANLPGGRDR